MKKILLDSWAWLEIFYGSQTGQQIKEIVKKAETVYTTTANLYEVMYREEQNQGRSHAENKREFIEHKSVIQDITRPVIQEALNMRRMHKLAAIDAFTLASANLLEATLVSGDPDFRSIKGVLYLGP